MIENKKFSFGQLFFGMVIMLFLGFCFGCWITNAGWSLSAIKAGVGEYKIVEPTTGETQFSWITNSIPVK
jgi:hypothetical protein